jgi:hypothetical protein
LIFWLLFYQEKSDKRLVQSSFKSDLRNFLLF